ncbi:MAG: alpha/beta hydrolase [Eubacterium sp.]|nr:alpha/beta hydrolase [Eubacterium sp.]
MGKRVRLCPEITDPGLRSFLNTVPAIRSFQTELVMAQPRFGKNHTVALAGREITVCMHMAQGVRPVIFEFHGGGFVFGNAEKDDRICQKLHKTLDCHVIGVNYRLAPEHPYPAAFDDAYDIIAYFHSHAAQYGIDPGKMAVMGYSGGATLATAVAIKCRREGTFSLCGQVLHYPYLDSVHLPQEKKHYDCDMDAEVMRAFTVLYSKEEERSLSYVSPVCAAREELAGTAPACILPAECDALKEEGILYAKMLKDAGVPVYCQVMPDVHHGYVEDAACEAAYQASAEDTQALHSPYFRDWAGAALDISCTFFKRCFDGD